MPLSTDKKDLRSIKTKKALNSAMSSLVKRCDFEKITVKDICDDAMISRATFYAHFTDKYDLLKDWLMHLKQENVNKDSSYEQMEEAVNQLVYTNKSSIKNLVDNANNETLDILFDVMLYNLELIGDERDDANPKFIFSSEFLAGGMLFYLLRQVKKNFPPGSPLMNIYLYEIIKLLQN